MSWKNIASFLPLNLAAVNNLYCFMIHFVNLKLLFLTAISGTKTNSISISVLIFLEKFDKKKTNKPNRLLLHVHTLSMIRLSLSANQRGEIVKCINITKIIVLYNSLNIPYSVVHDVLIRSFFCGGKSRRKIHRK